MDEVASVTSEEHEIGVRIGLVSTTDGLCQFAERKVDGDDTRNLASLLIERFAVGGKGFVLVYQTF